MKNDDAPTPDHQPIVPPPSTMTVDWLVKKPVLYTANGKPLARKVGF